MSRIFIINAAASFFHSKGELNQSLSELALQTLKGKGHEVRVTQIMQPYSIEEEINNYVWADVIIYQQPAWWMGTPWMLKKYLDEVLTHGHGKLYHSDGRTRSDATQLYGSGGLLQGKKYMISCTWNAPLEAFTEANQFFEAKGVDAVYFPFHKLNQFVGLSPLPTFSCHDVIKAGTIQDDFERFKNHLLSYIH